MLWVALILVIAVLIVWERLKFRERLRGEA